MNSIFPTFLFQYFEQCVIERNSETQNRLQKERFLSCAQQLFKFIRTKERVYRKKEFNSRTIGLEHQHAWRPF